ncbi:hypothetical protein J4217_04480 [Candidatus Pacearchaeota archaeon]|nr:hypothetical protein [Candidatus Pacearchaeota archaeon]
MKVLIFDSGPLINLSMNGLLYVLEELKKSFDGHFIITEAVKREVIDRPINIERFELGALRVLDLLNRGILEMPEILGVDKARINEETYRLMQAANHALRFKSKAINIVSDAEMSCLALSTELNKRKIENMIAIDERTTRIIGEDPENLEKLMSEKVHHPVRLDIQNLKEFKDHRFIRSAELVYVAYKKGIVNLEGKKVLEALIYAAKYKGSSISYDEINELKKL